ncbi:dynein regulatory complex protein 1 isoform X2 [Zootermopsis nevadensis]|uniref:Coiled-coil domain-containing protein 164 n=1 Tax=Zootermopsis nevadensis TaxID=136037 RepID=A0A067R106_ZOONE|nr:dynein regulatory complex protein 1 isoform X2 [Zootermopsis nevadensis]KDR12480.1 hypothetical protein L798_13724 [Zootermopsis nevadensis]
MEENANEEGASELQITSLGPNERKLARRLRIKKRLQKANQQQQLNGCQELEVDIKTMLEIQLQISEDQLERLLLDGKELITNVQVANDAREVKRRKDEVATREKRLERLEDQANESVEKFNVVNSRWKIFLESNDPLDLHRDMEEQKVKCAELISQKDKLIKELKTELRLADERFEKDQEKQKEDLWLVTERIDNQVKVMRKAYKDELKLIEEVIALEHKQLMEVSEKKWEALYKKHEKLEVEHMEKKFQTVDEYEDEIYKVAVEHHEKLREVKIKLESDIQVLQQELELVKGQCLMNSEKLVYNFQVLKRREEENLIVRAKQKRRINRLQDVVNNLKKKIAETEESTETESARLTEEVMRLQHNILDIEKKADHFAEVNDRKYQQVWELNRDTAKTVLDKVLDIDRILHEHQLGLEWTHPDVSLLRLEDLASYRCAMQVIADLFPEKGTQGKNDELKSVGLTVRNEDMEKLHAKERLLQNILKLVADNSDFLVEQKLNELLGPHTDKKKMLIKIDNVFTALGINTEAEIMMLKKCFLPYAKCSVCSTSVEEKMTTTFRSSHESIGSASTAGDTETAEAGMIFDTSIVKFGVDPAKAEQLLKDMDITAIEATSTPVKSIAGAKAKLHLTHSKPGCSETLPLFIDPVYVFKALRDFAVKFAPKEHSLHTNLKSVKHSTVSRLLSTQDVTAFWTRFRKIFSQQREKLWDGLLIGLQMYHRILEDRHKLNVDTVQLKRQNAELRRLLHFYIQNPEDESVFLSSWEHLPPISRNYRHKKSKMKFSKATSKERGRAIL